ncbi:MAG: hypothetical protein ACHREM_20505 [Polyangiales bacterium]
MSKIRVASWVIASLTSVAITSCGGGASESGEAPTTAHHADRKPAPSASTSGDPRIIPVGDVPKEIADRTGKILRRASQARHLEITAAVRLQVLPPAEVVAVVKKHVTDEVPRSVIVGEGHALAVLGLIPPDYDYEAESYALLEDQLAGLYIPENKTMYLSSTVDHDEIDGTLAHELVHALQDQRWSIGDKMKYRPAASDALGAIQALAEGDATSAMFDEMILEKGGLDALSQHSALDIPDQDPEEMLKEAIHGGSASSKRLAKSPRYVAVGLLAPYADGLRFVHGLRRRGGWNAVDEAWKRPPASGEQLLHLDKYDLNERAIEVATPTAIALGTSWKLTFDDVLGEEEARLAFGDWMDVDQAKRAVAGWGGDHLALFESGGDRAVAWRMVFDNAEEAKEAFGLLSTGFRAREGSPSFSEATATRSVFVFGGPRVTAPTKTVRSPPPKKKEVSKPGALPPLPDASGAGASPKDERASGLPQLPDATSSSIAATPKSTATLPGCRALRMEGAAVTLIAGAPCGVAGRWSEETGKAP